MPQLTENQFTFVTYWWLTPQKTARGGFPCLPPSFPSTTGWKLPPLPHFTYLPNDSQQQGLVTGHHQKREEVEEELEENGIDEKKLKEWRVFQNFIACGYPLKLLSSVNESHKEEMNVPILSHLPHSTTLIPSKIYYPLCTSFANFRTSFFFLSSHPPSLPFFHTSNSASGNSFFIFHRNHTSPCLAFSLSEGHCRYHQ